LSIHAARTAEQGESRSDSARPKVTKFPYFLPRASPHTKICLFISVITVPYSYYLQCPLSHFVLHPVVSIKRRTRLLLTISRRHRRARLYSFVSLERAVSYFHDIHLESSIAADTKRYNDSVRTGTGQVPRKRGCACHTCAEWPEESTGIFSIREIMDSLHSGRVRSVLYHGVP